MVIYLIHLIWILIQESLNDFVSSIFSLKQTLAAKKRKPYTESEDETIYQIPSKLWNGKIREANKNRKTRLSSDDPKLYADENSGFDLVNQVFKFSF